VDDQELKLALDLAVKYRQRLANWLHASGRIRKLEKHKKEDCGEEHRHDVICMFFEGVYVI